MALSSKNATKMATWYVLDQVHVDRSEREQHCSNVEIAPYISS